MLDLLNRSWTHKEVLASWRSVQIMAIPKKGKTPSGSSYRPISLLSSISKLTERLVRGAGTTPALTRNHTEAEPEPGGL